jgi:hypothetical protein
MYVVRMCEPRLFNFFWSSAQDVAIHGADTVGCLPLHYACASNPPKLEIIRVLVEANFYSVLQNDQRGCTPYQLAWRSRNRDVEVEAYLLEPQNEVANAMKETFADVANMQLRLPFLVTANVWSFAKPDLCLDT